MEPTSRKRLITEYAIDFDTSNTNDEVVVANQTGIAYIFN